MYVLLERKKGMAQLFYKLHMDYCDCRNSHVYKYQWKAISEDI